jgi:hypothetical protein
MERWRLCQRLFALREQSVNYRGVDCNLTVNAKN